MEARVALAYFLERWDALALGRRRAKAKRDRDEMVRVAPARAAEKKEIKQLLKFSPRRAAPWVWGVGAGVGRVRVGASNGIGQARARLAGPLVALTVTGSHLRLGRSPTRTTLFIVD
eukprot:scaffold315403_cov31-Tisochrysis_lutea.AAC.3